MVDHSKLELFNKTLANASSGTLVGNWLEERELRQATSVGRTVTNYHIPKVRQELFTLPPEEIQLENRNHNLQTADRIFCRREYKEFYNTNQVYGSQRNKADDFQKVGKRQQIIQGQQLEEIRQEYTNRQKYQQSQNDQRHFETTTATNFNEKRNNGVIGRMIMKDQNNNPILQQKDDPFFVEVGRIQRPVLSQQIKVDSQSNYLTHTPATYYEEKKHQGNFYRSTGPSFNLNNEFVKSFHDYSHIKL